MIIDQFDQMRQYFSLNPGIKKAEEWLKMQNWAVVENGKYAIDGEKVHAIVTTIEPKNLPDTRFEVHRKYIDMHVILEGVETVCYAPLADLISEVDYDPDRDCHYLTGEGQLIAIRPGQFWIALPTDAHWPAIKTAQSQPVRKVIVKLAVE